MTRDELKDIINESICEILEEQQENQILEEGFIKKAVEKIKAGIKAVFKGKSKEEKELEKEFKNSINLSTVPTFKANSGVIKENGIIYEGIFGSKGGSKPQTYGKFKSGKYTLEAVGRCDGLIVAICEEAKFRGNYVKLFDTKEFSLFNPVVVAWLISMCKFYENKYDTIVGEIVDIIKKEDSNCKLDPSKFKFIWGQARMGTRKECGTAGVAQITIGFETGDSAYPKMAFYADVCTKDGQWWNGGWRIKD